METATSVILIAVTAGIGLFLFLKGIRGAMKRWREETGKARARNSEGGL
jgi:hypothetical protein